MGQSLPEPIVSMIREEQARSGNTFVRVADLDAYMAKLAERAEILSDTADGRCRGFVAYYCNDLASKRAFITLVLVDPRDRGTGLAASLVSGVLKIARGRGFTSCRLEVAADNTAARQLYLSQGFALTGEQNGIATLEIAL